MGTVVEERKLQTEQGLYRLLVYTNATKAMINLACSINHPLAEELLKLKPRHRTMQLERSFLKVLASFPEAPIIKDIDVLFNYRAIVEMAERLPEETIQEDSNLLMYYDISLSRAEAEPTQLSMNIT